MKKIFRILVGSGLVVAIALLSFFIYLDHWSRIKTDSPGSQTLYFPKGTKLVELAGRLAAIGVIDHSFLYWSWIKVRQSYSRFQAGTYQFTEALTPREISAKLISGDIYQPVLLTLNIPEGFNSRDIAKRLGAHRVAAEEDVLGLIKDPTFIESLGLSVASLEGYLYPATYNFYTWPSPQEVLAQMVDKFKKMVNEGVVRQLAERELSLHQAIIFASLIEKETLHDDERTKISEVIWRRLKNKEPLGIDASTIYGIADFDGDLKWDHLKDRDNPYNSRINKGLPPGPIASPTIASIRAVLNPTNKGYYYYVLVADGEKRHHFSKTLGEHNHYVGKLMKATRRR